MRQVMTILKKLKSKLIIILLLVSLLMTSSTFAYWTQYVEGTSNTSTSQFQIGTYNMYHPLFLLSNQYDNGEYELDMSRILNGEDEAHFFNETFEAEWLAAHQWWHDYYTADAEVSIDYEIYLINDSGKSINSGLYKKLVKYIDVEFDEDNPNTLTMNGDAEQFGFSVTVEEPTKRNHYRKLYDLNLVIVISYTIDDVTYQFIGY